MIKQFSIIKDKINSFLKSLTNKLAYISEYKLKDGCYAYGILVEDDNTIDLFYKFLYRTQEYFLLKSEIQKRIIIEKNFSFKIIFKIYLKSDEHSITYTLVYPHVVNVKNLESVMLYLFNEFKIKHTNLYKLFQIDLISIHLHVF